MKLEHLVRKPHKSAENDFCALPSYRFLENCTRSIKGYFLSKSIGLMSQDFLDPLRPDYENIQQKFRPLLFCSLLNAIRSDDCKRHMKNIRASVSPARG